MYNISIHLTLTLYIFRSQALLSSFDASYYRFVHFQGTDDDDRPKLKSGKKKKSAPKATYSRRDGGLIVRRNVINPKYKIV